MEEELEDITIKHKGQSIDVGIEDLNGQYLQRHFKLQFEPATLVFVKPNGNRKLISIDKGKFQAGKTYYLEEEGNGQDSQGNSNPILGAQVGPVAIHHEKPKVTTDTWVAMQDVITNAIICSQASYASTAEECVKCLNKEIEKHSLSDITISQQHEGCHFVIAEEDPNIPTRHPKRVYIAFKGCHKLSERDLDTDLKLYQVENLFLDGSDQTMTGKVQSRFMERASQFPIETILSDKHFEDKEIIICGHALGGAIATIVAMNMMVAATKMYETIKKGGDCIKKRMIKCITFGAPMVGDSDIQELCNRLEISQNMFHLVNNEDPFPALLSLAQGLSASASMLDRQIGAKLLDNPMRDLGYEEDKKAWIRQRDLYKRVLNKVLSACNDALDTDSKVSGQHKICASVIREVVDFATKATDTVEGNQLTYVPVGNYFFYLSKSDIYRFLDYRDLKEIKANFEQCLEKALPKCETEVTTLHSYDCYEEMIRVWSVGHGKSLLKYKKYNFVQCFDHQDCTSNCTKIPRTVKVVQRYKPKITRGEVTLNDADDTHTLRLTLNGHNILTVIPEKCDFGGLFDNKRISLKRNRMCLTSNDDRLSFEEILDEAAPRPTIGDMGVCIEVTTTFGSCSFPIRKGQMRNVKIESVNQLCYGSSTYVVIQRAIQRGMAVSQIKNNMQQTNKSSADEELVKMVLKLSSKLLKEDQYKVFMETFEKSGQSIQFILSNKEEFDQIKKICIQLQEGITKPLNLYLKKTQTTRLAIATAGSLIGGLIAYIAGPALIIIGIADVVLHFVGGLAAAVTVLDWLLTKSLVDKQYDKVLAYIIKQLYQKHLQGKKSILESLKTQVQVGKMKYLEYEYVPTSPTDQLLQDVDDLVQEENTYSLEKALLKLYDKNAGFDNFKGSDVEDCTERSKKELMERIECVEIIHGIRKTLAQQCYIGVVGIQDAGKTTFLLKMWGIGGNTGQFTHTDMPCIFELDKRLAVVDYPGSNGLEYHAETFSICGAMNNMLIIVVPYTGDVSRVIGDEIKLAFEVASGSEATKMILCINQCGLKLPTAIKNELKDHEDPIDYLKQRFASRLNEFYVTKGLKHVNVCKDDIFFTDWLLDDETRGKYGISGVEDIKEEIKAYLMKQKIFNKKETDLLEECLSHNFPARHE